MKAITTSVHVACIFTTMVMLIRCLCIYLEDADVSVVQDKKFEEDGFPYPSFSFCFFDPFIEKELEKVGTNVTLYKAFLAGYHWDKMMLDIDFESVTKDLKDFIVGYNIIHLHNGHNTGEEEYYTASEPLPSRMKAPYLSFVSVVLGSIVKCYTFDLPFLVSKIVIKREIFPNRIRPTDLGFAVTVHYPNQLLSSLDTFRTEWPADKENGTKFTKMSFKIHTFEVTKRRNTKKNKCNTDYEMDDFIIAKTVLEDIKCKPHYPFWNSSYPFCASKEKVAVIPTGVALFGLRDALPKPCSSVTHVLYDYQDFHHPADLSEDHFTLEAILRGDKFKLIELKKEYSFEALIGNGGGYIGLFLGMKP